MKEFSYVYENKNLVSIIYKKGNSFIFKFDNIDYILKSFEGVKSFFKDYKLLPFKLF